MNDNAATIIVVLALLLIMGACERCKYQECRAVGHSTFYCLSRGIGE